MHLFIERLLFIAALYIKAKSPATGKWINEIWYIHTKKYQSKMKGLNYTIRLSEKKKSDIKEYVLYDSVTH